MRIPSLGAGTKKAARAKPERPRIIDMLYMTEPPKNGKAKDADSLFSEANVTEARRAKAWLNDRLEKSKKLHANNIVSEVVNVTPELAEIILSTCNRGNRGLSQSHIERLAEIMREGRWMLTSQGISITREGLLNDGQHRLNAIVRSGRPQRMTVMFGEDREVFPVLDVGRVRRAADALHIDGYKNVTGLAAGARLFSIVTSDGPLRNRPISNDAIRQIVKAHPGLHDVSTPAIRITRATNCSKAAAVAAIYLIATNSKFERRLDFFIERLVDGEGLRSNDAVKVLRDGLMKRDFEGPGRDGTAKNICVCAAIIIAWNRWVRGTPTRQANLRWSIDDQFPQVV